MLSVHETVLSVTDSSYNNNKAASEDNVKLINTNNFEDDALKISYQDSETGEKDTLLKSETGKKIHNFWPPGMIIQTPVTDLDYNASDTRDKVFPGSLSADDINGSTVLDSAGATSPNYADDNIHLIRQSENVLPDICLKSNGSYFSPEVDESDLENTFLDEIEYEAVLEPDIESPEACPSYTEFESKDEIIVDVTSSTDPDQMHAISEIHAQKISFQSFGTFAPNIKKYPSLEAEQHLFPIEETERDESDVTNILDSNPEGSTTESMNSYNIIQSKSINQQSKGKIHNGFEPFRENPVEASDLGYFSLDKETNISVVPEKMTQAEYDLISAALHGKVNRNENICANFMPDILDETQSNQKTFVKSEIEIKDGKLYEANIQSATSKDALLDSSFKSLDPFVKEVQVFKSEDYSSAEGIVSS